MANLHKTVALTGNAVIDSVIGGGAWNAAVLNYGFKPQDIDKNGIDDFSEGDWKVFYREIYDNVSSFANIDFVESSYADANLVQRLDVGGGGESGGPGIGVSRIETAVGIDPTSVKAAADVIRLGTYSLTWLHEIGHSLGLKHTHDTDAGAPLPGVADPLDKGTGNLNSQIYSVMGYTYPFWGEDNPFTDAFDPNTTLNAQPGSFGAIDIAALQQMYGARAHNTGDTVYRFSDDVDFNHGYTTIWDTGGIDTIAYDGASRAKIDLRAATLQAEIGGGGWLSTSQTLTGGYTIAHGVTIENAIGGSAADILIGNAANNVLDGRAGADSMRGLGGNDTYLVDNSGDLVFEAVGDGNDTVVSTVSYTLAAGQEIEMLQLAASTGSAALNLTGNAFANTLIGNAGANTLNGGAGADILKGMAGNDVYLVDNAGDQVIEAVRGGNDTVVSTVSYTLAAGQEIETLQLAASTGHAALNLTGNAFANTIRGNAGANVLDGGLGKDTLYGNGGADTFVFKTAIGPANVDHIADFVTSASAVHDTIQLAKSVFTTLAVGELSAAAFKVVGTSAIDADDRILYNKATGALSYDADGSGTASAAVQFAILDNKAALGFQDILVV